MLKATSLCSPVRESQRPPLSLGMLATVPTMYSAKAIDWYLKRRDVNSSACNVPLQRAIGDSTGTAFSVRGGGNKLMQRKGRPSGEALVAGEESLRRSPLKSGFP